MMATNIGSVSSIVCTLDADKYSRDFIVHSVPSNDGTIANASIAGTWAGLTAEMPSMGAGKARWMAPKKNMFRMESMLAFTGCFLRYTENSPYEDPAAMASMTPFRFLRCARSKTISRPRMLAPSARIFLPVMRSIFNDDSRSNDDIAAEAIITKTTFDAISYL